MSNLYPLGRRFRMHRGNWAKEIRQRKENWLLRLHPFVSAGWAQKRLEAKAAGEAR